MWQLQPGAEAISEFASGFTGDCGQTAELCALHVALGDALNSTQLSAIVTRDVAHHLASANGAEPLSSIAADLTLAGAHYTSHGFAQPYSVDWRSILRANCQRKPVILEFADAGALPGDEAGARFHFVAALGGDPASDRYAVADGDNVAARAGQLVTYTLAQLEAAQVCGCIVVEVEFNSMWTKDSSGAHDANGKHVGEGVAAAILADAALAGSNAILPETYISATESITCLDNDAWIIWDGAAHVISAGGKLVAQIAQRPGDPRADRALALATALVALVDQDGPIPLPTA